MLDPVYLEAWTHRPGGHTVLGRKLHPLSALDLLALEAVNSPFLYDGAKCELSHLILAVWILSNPHESDLTVGNLELNAEGQKWLDSLSAKPRWWQRKKSRLSIDMDRDTKAVVAYMADYYSLPEMYRHSASTPITALGSPWMLSTVVYVASKLHLPLREAWTMGIGQLFWYRCSIEEQETESRVISPERRAEMEKAGENSKSFTLGIGETLAEFSRRTGISEGDAAVLLHNSTKRN